MASQVIQANIDVHTRMAASYDRLEPHFRPENRAKVRKILEGLRARCGGGKLLDLGCGTGFIIGLVRDLFDDIHGVDVTQAMLDRVDTSSGNIHLHRGPAEKTPFADATFDLVTAYSFIHHVQDYQAVVAEGYRVLKPGGLFYIDLEPNKLYWDAMAQLANKHPESFPPIVAKAWNAVLHTDAMVERDFGIPKSVFQQAEYGKAILGGVDAPAVEKLAAELGFSDCAIRYEWYLGQAEVMHGQSFEEAARIESFLRSISPLSDHLFKYVQFILTK